MVMVAAVPQINKRLKAEAKASRAFFREGMDARVTRTPQSPELTLHSESYDTASIGNPEYRNTWTNERRSRCASGEGAWRDFDWFRFLGVRWRLLLRLLAWV